MHIRHVVIISCEKWRSTALGCPRLTWCSHCVLWRFSIYFKNWNWDTHTWILWWFHKLCFSAVRNEVRYKCCNILQVPLKPMQRVTYDPQTYLTSFCSFPSSTLHCSLKSVSCCFRLSFRIRSACNFCNILNKIKTNSYLCKKPVCCLCDHP